MTAARPPARRGAAVLLVTVGLLLLVAFIGLDASTTTRTAAPPARDAHRDALMGARRRRSHAESARAEPATSDVAETDRRSDEAGAGKAVLRILRHDGSPLDEGLFWLTEDLHGPATRVDGGRAIVALPEEGDVTLHGLGSPPFAHWRPVVARVLPGEVAEVRLPGPDTVRLRVSDAETGMPLAAARIRARGGGTDGIWSVRPATTPIDALPVDPQGVAEVLVGDIDQRVYVTASGYATTSLLLDPRQPGEKQVALRAGGTLRIEVTGFGRLVDPILTLTREAEVVSREPDGSVVEEVSPAVPVAVDAEMTGDDAVLRVRGLEPRRYGIQLACDGTRSVSYGSTAVVVAAGTEAFARIHAEFPSGLAPAVLLGSVRVPAAWREAVRAIELCGAEGPSEHHLVTAALEASEGGVLRIAPTRVFAGDYLVWLRDLEWLGEVAVPSDGSEVWIDVPAPGELLVRVLDPEGAEAAEASVAVEFGELLGADHADVRRDLAWDDSARAFRGRCAAGNMRLIVTARAAGADSRWLTEWSNVTVSPAGRTETLVRLAGR